MEFWVERPGVVGCPGLADRPLGLYFLPPLELDWGAHGLRPTGDNQNVVEEVRSGGKIRCGRPDWQLRRGAVGGGHGHGRDQFIVWPGKFC